MLESIVSTISANPSLWTGITLLTQQLLMGKYLSLNYRLRTVNMEKDQAKALLDSKEFKIAHATQLNNAEWTPSFVVGMLFLHSVGKGNNMLLAGSVAGSCINYCFWKIYLNGRYQFLMPLCAVWRYTSFSWMLFELITYANSL